MRAQKIYDREKLLTLILVHGFVNATYFVVETDELDTFFRLEVKGYLGIPGYNIQGTVTTMAGGTASK